MTVITKPLSEKKTDKSQEPLVDEIKVGIVEAGGTSGGDPSIERRISSPTTACLLLTALLVMSGGIISGFSLYAQFGRAQVQRFVCSIPLSENGGQPMTSELQGDNRYHFSEITQKGEFFHEEVEIDENYEKITVPDFSGNRRSRFIHDFKSNKTCIIDLDDQRCFIMPLNTSTVLPPSNLLDVIEKMRNGYYNVDTRILRETMRVITPAIENRSNLGPYILAECSEYPIYKLEKYVSGVYKRSVGTEVNFVEFAGKNTHELEIVNYGELEDHEQRPVAMA